MLLVAGFVRWVLRFSLAWELLKSDLTYTQVGGSGRVGGQVNERVDELPKQRITFQGQLTISNLWWILKKLLGRQGPFRCLYRHNYTLETYFSTGTHSTVVLVPSNFGTIVLVPSYFGTVVLQYHRTLVPSYFGTVVLRYRRTSIPSYLYRHT